MSNPSHKSPPLRPPPSRRRRQGSTTIARSNHAQPSRSWAGLSPEQILDRYRIGRTPPTQVLEVLLRLFNGLHTSLEKTVSYKTREERAQFLRRFFRDLQLKAGYRSLPDPRNFGHRHILTMVKIWQHEQLSPGTIQSYLSYLRALAMWLGKPGLVRKPDHYGLRPGEYKRSGSAERDKTWTAHGIDIEAVIAQVSEYDPRVAASMRLCRALGLRLKESVMFRPHGSVLPFDETGLPSAERTADLYVRIKEGSKGGRSRYIPLDSEARLSAVRHAQTLVTGADAHLGDPLRDLKSNLRRFAYVMEKFGITSRMLGVTTHGLRHEFLNRHYEEVSGFPSPVRGGECAPCEVDRAARSSVAALAGHGRRRASNAYLGGVRRNGAADANRVADGAGPDPTGTDDDDHPRQDT